jgi:hypothetical protein
MAKSAEPPPDFKASEQDVDTEATVTRLAGEDETLPEWKPRRRSGPAPASEDPAAAPVRVRRSQSWLSKLLKSLFG